YWLGYEDSAVIWGEHLYISCNAGLMQCINLNTMDIVWVNDTWDDTNGSPVLELDEENHTAYIYIGTSLHFKANSEGRGDVAFFKFDAVTGELIWKDVRNVATVSGVSGGIQATAVVGKHSINDLVIVPYARTPSTSRGLLVALNKQTGEEVWSFETENYSWSSPIAIYDDAGRAYIVQADTRGHVYLLDGRTGELLDTLYFEDNNFEASPVAYGDMIVIGSRAAKIYGIKIH
ncbi:PQQ-binding-like beta-propeller repeat protein, partial [Eubacteriales bacterium OttesenSCG-928-K08]|nr:PQQ-binding-like beta-propeller repeat protein [Eubacteriales bacterium OttesenSCG-928-K08]